MAEETIYLCKFRVSVDGDWLCLKELSDVQFEVPPSLSSSMISEDGKKWKTHFNWSWSIDFYEKCLSFKVLRFLFYRKSKRVDPGQMPGTAEIPLIEN